MDKAEALSVLHEICDLCRDSVMLTCLSLDSSQVERSAGAGYQIRLKCDLNKAAKECLEPIVEKHNLVLREEKGYVIVSVS